MPNIYLVGFMGTGKTATARLLASRLDRKFVDMDALIVERQKMSIPEIFQSQGEVFFRGLEREIVSELASLDGLVVACGGGVFVNEENIIKLKESGTVVCLTASPGVILERTSRFEHRPLLNVSDPKKRIEELLSLRAAYYAKAHHTINTDGSSVEETVEAVLKSLKTDG